MTMCVDTTKMPISLFEKTATPFYYYDMKLLNSTLVAIKEALPAQDFKLHYAVKANSEIEILKAVAKFGFGADCVSGGEIKRSLDAGIPAEKIVFAGVGKTDEEIRLAINVGIGCFNVESIQELEIINQIASEMNRKATIALRLNPNIDAHTHEYITTGLKENKFGLSISQLPKIADTIKKLSNVIISGIHLHIGSQITILKPFVILCQRIKDILKIIDDYGLKIKTINVGGGLGVDYDNPDQNPIPDFKRYFDCFKENLSLKQGQELHFELGRAVVAQCGSLISRVLYVKEGEEKKFIILDAGMTDLIRPALYQAHHAIQNLSSTANGRYAYDVVGPICESSDCFASAEILPTTVRGDIIAIRSAGAYGQTMASRYNCRPLPKAIFSEDF